MKVLVSMCMLRNLFVAFALIVSASLTCPAQAPPSADAYVTSAQPAANFGNSIMLPVQAGTTSYMRLNLGTLPANATVAKATLRLYVNAVVTPGSFDVYQVNGGWSERGLIFNNAPPLGVSATGEHSTPVTGSSLNQFILIDVTSLAQGWLNGSIPNYGVALALTSAAGGFSFDSKESTGHQPELEVVLSNAAEAAVTSSVVPTVTARTKQGTTQLSSSPYINNGTALQVGANFNIDGSGSAASLNAASQFSLAGTPVLGINGTSSLFVGPGAGQSNTGSQNTFIGLSAGQSNTTGTDLTFVGALSGLSNSSGNYNSFMGTNSGLSNTTGSLLTFLGMQSGFSNTTGSYNSFVGTNSGYANTTGNFNSFVGTGSGGSNTSGSYLTFMGMRSGLSNTTGNYNSFLGTYAGFSNTTGSLLTFLGMQSGYSNTTGSFNSFVGTNSGYANTSGGNNSFLGAGSGGSNTSGSFLTFLGMRSGLSNTTGNNNTFVGTYSGFSNNTGSSNTFVGFNSGLNANPAGNNNVYVSNLGGPSDNGTIRIGDPVSQTATYVAGISGASTNSGVPVFVDSSGKLGTAGSGLSFQQLIGTLTNAQLSGAYSSAVTLSNINNAFSGAFAGNGVGLTSVNAATLGGFSAAAFAPASGSGSYVQNGTITQVGTSFNIDGNGTIGGTVNANSVNSATNYQVAGGTILAIGRATDQNLFVGNGAGTNNTTGSGQGNTLSGYNAGTQNTTGSNNTFGGASAGQLNTVGSGNTYVGANAGHPVVTGSNNSFLGFNAGISAGPAASNDVYISNQGVARDNGTIRIGDPANQSATYIAGIAGSSTNSGTPVFVDSTGKLGTGGGTVNFTQVAGTLASPQFSGTYNSTVTLTNTTNSFTGSFAGNGAGLTGVSSGLSWPIVTKSANYTVQTSDFSTPTRYGNFVILTGTLSRTFTLPNPPPPNGSCVAIGNVADPGINSGTNAFLSVNPNGLSVDASVTTPTQPRRVAYLYCSDGIGYYRLGYNQNGVSEIGPWLETLDTGTANVLTTTFRNGMDFGLIPGTMFYIRPLNNNTITNPTLNVNGLGAKHIVKFGNQPLAPNDLTTAAYAQVFYDGTNWQLLNPQTAQGTTPTLTGTTGGIGGSSLTAGNCTTGTATVTGATVGHPVSVSASDGSLPNGLIILSAAVTSPNTVTVQLCATASVTPLANTYNVATQ
jgi:hypothetical protein